MCNKKKITTIRQFLAMLTAFAVTTLSTNAALAAVTWEIAPGRTSIEFKVKHFLMLNVKGKFKKFSGKVITKSGMDFEDAQVEATIPVSSVFTGNQDRDAHLLENDFFNAAKFPEMKFKSTNVVKTAKDKWKMRGTLTIRNVAQPVELEVKHIGDKKLANGKICCNFRATGSLNRYNFGLKWNEITETGGLAVSETVQIAMNVALVRQQ